MPSPSPLDWISDELRQRESQGLRRFPQEVRNLPHGECEVRGRLAKNFAGNDYLGLAFHPDVIAAGQAAMAESGAGAGASPVVSGRGKWHAALEASLAQFEGAESAILFSSGMAANLGTIAALVGPGDLVVTDRLNHASLIDGSRLSGAKLAVYRHTNLDKLARLLGHATGFRRRLIVTDGVFSMDGNLAPLNELADIADQFGAMLMVDEAHGTGVFGESLRGAAQHCGVEHRVGIRMGTLSKALGSVGGFVSGSSQLTSYLWNHARTQIYSTALPPSACAAAAAALDVIGREPERAHRLRSHADCFRAHLSAAGVPYLALSAGPIVPIILHDPERAVAVANKLLDEGFLVGAIRPPTVPAGTSRLRITLSAVHSEADLATLAGLLQHFICG